MSVEFFKTKMLVKICRLCCANEGTIDLFNNTDALTPYYKILYCFDKSKVCIEKNDNLPKQICLQCEDELTHCYDFILKCEIASKKFCALELVQDTENNDDALDDFEYKYINDNVLKVNNYSPEVNDDISDDDKNASNAILPVKEEDNSSEQKLKRKKRKTSNKVPLQCPTCKKCFFYNSVLLKHIKIHLQNTKSVVKKESKSKVFNDITKRNGKRVKKSLGPKECPVCHKVCLNNSRLVSHLKTHSGVRPFKCSSCNKSYKDPIGLKKHERSHFGSKNYVCDNCGKCFASKAGLDQHKRTHTGEKPYECKLCSTKFSQISSLLMHQRRLHTGIKPFKCTQCKKGFVSKYELKMHFVTHGSEKKYNCVICNKWFKFKGILKKHIDLHSGNKTKFICDYCGFVCNFKGNLAIHIFRMHSTKSGFCNICLKQESNITEHMGKHKGDRPFKCEYCPSKFLDKRGLQYHVNFKHTKSDKYKCDKAGCEASFPSRPMLNHHNSKVHATLVPFPCDLCSRSFYRKSDYARHKVGTHKQKIDDI